MKLGLVELGGGEQGGVVPATNLVSTGGGGIPGARGTEVLLTNVPNFKPIWRVVQLPILQRITYRLDRFHIGAGH